MYVVKPQVEEPLKLRNHYVSNHVNLEEFFVIIYFPYLQTLAVALNNVKPSLLAKPPLYFNGSLANLGSAL